jgi:7-carboxy-7-deazaguanine synthase
MPVPSILGIKEIFWSFQGEGLRVGFPTIFLRFYGCSLHCPYCDSKSSWKPGPVRWMSLPEILGEVEIYREKYPGSQVVLTGGEPLEQDLASLTAALKTKGFFLSLETNGRHFQDLALDWWTVSPKDVSGYFIHEELLKKITEIKLVVNKNLTMETIKRLRGKLPEQVPIFLQPDGFDRDRYKNTFSLFRHCREEKIRGLRVGVQLHKIYRVK